MINKSVFSKTKKTLILYNLIIVQTFMVIMCIFIYGYFKASIYSSIDKNLELESKNVIVQFGSNDNLNPITLLDQNDLVYIYEGDKIRYYSNNIYFDKILPFKENLSTETFKDSQYHLYSFREYNSNFGKYHIRILRDIGSELNSLNHILMVLVVSGIISLFIIYLISIILMKKALVPIEKVWIKQAKFIQDASHELRTPIAIIQAKLERMLKKPNSTIEEEYETIAISMRETRRLKKMINDLLALTKEDAIVKTNSEEFNIKDILNELNEDYFEIAEYQNKKFVVDFNMKNNLVYTDKNKLIQIIRIIIDNAFKYTNSGDKIVISVNDKSKDYFSIKISDTGIGIKKEDQAKIFDRFYRTNDVRATTIDGSGIGLSIAKMMCLNLNGNISVSSELKKGTTFIVILPKKNLNK